MESDDTRRTLTPLLWCATCLANLVQRCTCAPPSRARAKGQEAGRGGEGGKHSKGQATYGIFASGHTCSHTRTRAHAHAYRSFDMSK